MKKVRFKNRFGIELAGDLYLPAAKYEVLPLRKFSQRITVRRLTILACWKDAENGTFALGSHAGILDYCKENDTNKTEVVRKGIDMVLRDKKE